MCVTCGKTAESHDVSAYTDYCLCWEVTEWFYTTNDGSDDVIDWYCPDCQPEDINIYYWREVGEGA